MRRAPCLLAVLLAASCGRSGFQLRPGTNDTPTPTPTATVVPTPVPAGETIDPGDNGSGVDGDTDFDGSVTFTVNTCLSITRTTEGDLEVIGQLAPTVDRRLFLHQTQDNYATVADAGPYDANHPPGAAGLWQIVALKSAVTIPNGMRLDVEPDAANFFGSNDQGRSAQLCTMPQYLSVRVLPPATLVAPMWDTATKTGGILAFFAVNGVQIEGTVTVSGLGLRGGPAQQGTGGMNSLGLTTAADAGGRKGESSDGTSFLKWGRGNFGAGGGGGNRLSAGGGGGGNGGAGGRGGSDQCEAFACDPNSETFGMPGAPYDFPAGERLFLGGGGGAGHRPFATNGLQGAGGNGGGLVLISAFDVRAPNGGALLAQGAPGHPSSAGAGGGGAGGTIWILVDDPSPPNYDGGFSVAGGTGGDWLNGIAASPSGPGGGGSGGRIRVDGPPPPDLGTVVDLIAGVSGLCNSPNCDPTLGAEDGSAGVLEN